MTQGLRSAFILARGNESRVRRESVKSFAPWLKEPGFFRESRVNNARWPAPVFPWFSCVIFTLVHTTIKTMEEKNYRTTTVYRRITLMGVEPLGSGMA